MAEGKEAIPTDLGLNILGVNQAEQTQVGMGDMDLGSLSGLGSISDPEKSEEELEEAEAKVEEQAKKAEEAEEVAETIEDKEDEATEEEAEETKEVINDDSSGEDDSEESVQEEESEGIKAVAEYLGEKGIVDYDPEKFEDSEEGFETLIKDTVKNGVENFKNSLGDLSQNYINYIENGGDPQYFIEMYSMPDFARIDTEKLEDDESTQEALMREFYRLQQYSAEETEQEITELKDSGMLYNKSKRALGKLTAAQENERLQLAEQQKYAKQRQIDADKNFLKELKEDITERTDILGFKITEKDKSSFYDYITKFDRKTGKTQMMMDAEKDPDSQLKMAYLYYKNFDFSQVEKKAAKDVKRNLKKNLDAFNNVTRNKLQGSSKGNTERSKKSGELDMSLLKKSLDI